MGTPLARVVATSAAVAATAARSAKVAALADLLGSVAPGELPTLVALLTGRPRQGRIGVGWATLARHTPLTPEAGAPATAPAGPALTLAELDRALDELAVTAGAGSAGRRDGLLAELLGRATTAEGAFLVRLLSGELRQGALDAVVGDAVAKAAAVPPALVRRAAMLTGDLGQVAQLALTEGGPALERARLEVLRPVLPMLAASAPDVTAALGLAGGRAAVEWKLDGARLQAHRRGEVVRLFTRSLREVTHALPDVAAAVGRLPADRLVLDGEVLGVGDGDRPERFQDTMAQFSRADGGGRGLGVWWFDLLHRDGDDLLDQPLEHRWEELRQLTPDLAVPGRITDDPAVAAQVLEASLAAGHEGVVVKAADSPYEAGRRGGTWRKFKPVTTLDLIVLAVEWGHGRRQGWLSNLHLGARGPDGPVMVGKTFKGLTDELLAWQTARFLELETGRRGGAVLVRPVQVVEVAIDGVQASTRYPGGVALRFARVRRYRGDKGPEQADPIGRLQDLRDRIGG